MAIHVRRAGDVAILEVAGPLVLEQFGALKQEVRELGDAGWRKIVLDLHEVPYVDSIGVAEIVRAHSMLTSRGGRLMLVGLPERVRELLDITGLLTILEHRDTEQAALEEFGRTSFG